MGTIYLNMKTNLEKQLFEGYRGAEQFITIPLKHQEDSLLNPQPNFLVIDKVFGYNTVPLKQPDGSEALVECQNTLMRLVYREVLEEDNEREGVIREIVMDEIGNIYLPFMYIPKVRNHEALVQNEDFVNHWMTMFSFRGVLEGFNVEYDKERSEEYLEKI